MADTFPSLFWSYTVVWTFLALYIFWLGVRLSRLERKLGTLRKRDTTASDGETA
jgi:CcmD family protein